jgi:LemA protein
MRILAIAAGMLVAVGIVLGASLILKRNELLNQKELIRTAWTRVDIALEQRADLVPDLVKTLQGLAPGERAALESISEARAAMAAARTPAERIAANDRLSAALGRLLAAAENNPPVKSDRNFQRLEDELTATANRIAVERRQYNELVLAYNIRIQLFPNTIVAALLGIEREEALRAN